MKKILCLLLCVALLLPALTVFAAAEEYDDAFLDTNDENVGKTLHQIVKEEARLSYVQARAAARRGSFAGWCGLMVSHQLKVLGINAKRISQNGNDQYDYYYDKETTNGGYYIQEYDAAQYSLEEALKAVCQDGKRDVRNVMVCFQWTNTDAGRYFGHVLLVNGIIEGRMYFVESFYCPVGNGGEEGTVISCTIEEFAAYFNKWTTFEGLIHFGTGRYADVCTGVPTDLTVQARFDCQLRSEPALVGQKGCYAIRQIAAGERLQVTGIYSDDRTLYYEVVTPEGVGYVSPNAVSTVAINSQSLTFSGAVPTQFLPVGEKLALEGNLVSDRLTVQSVEACVYDATGKMAVQLSVPGNSLEELADSLHLEHLIPGDYRLEIHADTKLYEAVADQEWTLTEHMTAWSAPLRIGDEPAEAAEEADFRTGWVYDTDCWKLMLMGQPCTGWVTLFGVRHYLLEDGSPATGWNMVDDKLLYFSAFGALVTGWLNVNGQTYYLQNDGSAYTGWLQMPGGAAYHFADDGVMTVSGEMQKDGVTYVFAPDGKATVKE